MDFHMRNLFTMILQGLINKSKDKTLPQEKTGAKASTKKKDKALLKKTILTVFLSNNEQILTEVPITPETTCRDVVEFCKEPGEGACHLAEVWRGNERALPFDHLMFEHLQKWGPRREEVKFFLRHEEFPVESNEQAARQAPNQRNGLTGEKRLENGVGNPRVELTLSELQDMASRQQQQIENQQQMLVAKEQRLRYLKQQERRQLQTVSETEKLQKLKERVETQENKLKKIRAMRGQVDYSKVMNGNLSTEIEHISDMFQEKQQELQAAVLKVEQLTQQLEDLRKGKLNGFQAYGQMTGPAALELKKLYQELQIRNRLNQEQNTKLLQQKELLNKRNMEVAIMDKRINELRERLYKKKVELNRINGTPSSQSTLTASGRVAAVGPYIQIPSTVNYPLPADPVKPQSLSLSASGTQPRSKSEGDNEYVKKSPGPWKVSDLDILVDPVRSSSTSCLQSSDHNVFHQAPGLSDTLHSNDTSWPTLKQSTISVVKTPPLSTTDWNESGMEPGFKTAPISSQPLPSATVGPTEKLSGDAGKLPSPMPGLSKSLPHNYGMYQGPLPLSATNSLERRKDGSLPRPGSGSTTRTRPLPLPATNIHPPGSSQQIQQRISVPPSPTYPPSTSPLFPGTDARPDPPLTVAIRPFLAEKGSRPQSPRKGPQTVNSSSIYSMYLQQSTPPKNYQQAVYNTLNKSVKAVYGKPVVQSSSSNSSPLPFLHSGPAPNSDKEGEAVPATAENTGVENIPRPLSPTKLTPIVHSPMRYQSDADLEALRRKLANAPRPLKKRSSITEPEGPSGPNIQKLLYQRFNTLAGGMEGSAPFYQQCNSQDFVILADVDNGNTGTNGNMEEASSLQTAPVPSTPPLPQPPPPPQQPPEPQVSADDNDNKVCSPITEEPSSEIINQISETTEDNNNNNPAIVPSVEKTPSPVLEVASPVKEEVPSPPSAPSQSTAVSSHVKRTNLKKPNSERTGHGLRVKFNPLALLLDASLEGEFDLVQRIIYEVEDPSKPNDEGITPLHNAVCAGHHHIVKFLLDFGVNVNAADSDGWTPLHCAASCNSVHLCKMLVECGAAIFATTISDIETAADKCEEMEEGYIQCSQFLYGVQEKLGVMNKGLVYGLWDYEAQNADELSFREGDAITILRRKDDAETDWWWARLNDKEGYVPKNLLGLYPRIKPRQRTLA
ncbi:apoptosis-stimulating of p53 protein 1 isoform X3 [Hyla sarda]|uniref:apoptosis-stimulating of p53 protein 1 isoform X3 n=1 Tax=Hyla sarda TaxID=327740 RepID=UPI0024C263E1|nr:apoptosis-stimulating of p53 protein 1 isoform X3 [Hyla sarda]